MSGNIGSSQPINASTFINSLGVNTHLDFSFIPAYQNLSMVESNLTYLGVKNVRDSAQTASDAAVWQQVAQATGVKFDDYIPETSQAGMQAALGFMPQLANEGILNSVEGGDEEDDAYPKSLGNTLAATATVQQQLWTLGNQLGLPVINMSFGSGWTAANNWQGDYGAVGNLSAYTTYGNAHTYPSGAPNGSMQQINGLAQLAAPGKPVITTEIGWNTSSTTPITAAKYTLDAAFDGMLDGDVKTYFYALYNDNSGNWGLFNSNGTPQPSAVALHDLTTLLNDPGTNAATFKPTALNYALSGTAAGDTSLLLEKSDGTYWLALWNEQQALNTSHTVTLTLQGSASEVEIFDPLTGITALQTYHNTASVQVTVPDHPVLVEIIGAAATATTPTTTATPTPVSPNPVITTPVSETMTVGTTINLSGISISDPWAANNPGQLALNISATDGTLWMTDTTGTTISGSGTNYINVSGSLAQLDADLTNLKFSGTTSGGYGLVSVNVFDQAGAQATKTLGITINAAPAITLAAPILNETVVAGQSLSNLWSQIVGNGTDSVSSNTLSVTSLGTTGTIGKVALNTATDTVDYTAGAYNANAPVDSFTYTLSDGQGGTSTGTVDVTITAPVAATVASALGQLPGGSTLPAAVTIDVTNVGQTAYAPSRGWELNSQASGQTLVSSAQGEDVLSGGGDTNFFAQGIGNIIAGTSGNHHVFANSGNTYIAFSGGNNNIIGFGSGDTIITGTGNNFVWGQNGNTTITMADGNQDINLYGADNKVSVGTGNELIDAGFGGGESVAISGGSGQVSAGGLGDKININSGNFTVTSYTGQDTIEAGSGNEAIYAAGNTNVIAIGNGNSTIDAFGNDNSISVGSGTDTLNLSGTGTSVELVSGIYKISDSGNGNTFSFNGSNSTADITVNSGDTVGFSNGGNTLSMNSGGSSTIYVGVGDSNTITVGAGNDTIYAFGSHNSITLGFGNDTLTFAGSNNTILLGAGNATLNDSGSGNTIVLNGASQGVASIYGYVLQDGETFDLSKVLAQTNWNHDLASIGNYIKVSSNSYESTISVDQSGQPGGVTQTVAVLHGEGYLNLNGLLSHSVT